MSFLARLCLIPTLTIECTMRVSLQPRCSAAICWGLCARLYVPVCSPHPTQASTPAVSFPPQQTPHCQTNFHASPLHLPCVNEGLAVNLRQKKLGWGVCVCVCGVECTLLCLSLSFQSQCDHVCFLVVNGSDWSLWDTESIKDALSVWY